MKIMLIPVGEQTQPLYEGFRHYNGIKKIILIYTNKTHEMAMEIKRWAEKMIEHVVLVETVASDIGTIIDNVVSKCPEIIYPEAHVISNLSGGTKPMSHACYVITSITGGESFYIFLNDKNKMEFVEMPRLNVCLGDIFSEKKRGSKTRIRMLRSIYAGNHSLASISRSVGIKKPSVLNHLRKLADAGLVDYNGKSVTLTTTGRLVLRIKSILDAKEKVRKYG